MNQHIGKPCAVAVKVGDKVQKGDLVGIIDKNSLGSNIHASISGVIKEIKDNKVVIVSDK